MKIHDILPYVLSICVCFWKQLIWIICNYIRKKAHLNYRSDVSLKALFHSLQHRPVVLYSVLNVSAFVQIINS